MHAFFGDLEGFDGAGAVALEAIDQLIDQELGADAPAVTPTRVTPATQLGSKSFADSMR